MELRATSDTLLADLEALTALEGEKRATPLNDARLVELADRIREIAVRVLNVSTHQQALTQEALAEPGAEAPIAEVQRSPAAILADWRDYEQRLMAAAADSPEHAELEILTARARQEYRRAFDAASREDAERTDPRRP